MAIDSIAKRLCGISPDALSDVDNLPESTMSIIISNAKLVGAGVNGGDMPAGILVRLTTRTAERGLLHEVLNSLLGDSLTPNSQLEAMLFVPLSAYKDANKKESTESDGSSNGSDSSGDSDSSFASSGSSNDGGDFDFTGSPFDGLRLGAPSSLLPLHFGLEATGGFQLAKGVRVLSFAVKVVFEPPSNVYVAVDGALQLDLGHVNFFGNESEVFDSEEKLAPIFVFSGLLDTFTGRLEISGKLMQSEWNKPFGLDFLVLREAQLDAQFNLPSFANRTADQKPKFGPVTDEDEESRTWQKLRIRGVADFNFAAVQTSVMVDLQSFDGSLDKWLFQAQGVSIVSLTDLVKRSSGVAPEQLEGIAVTQGLNARVNLTISTFDGEYFDRGLTLETVVQLTSGMFRDTVDSYAAGNITTGSGLINEGVSKGLAFTNGHDAVFSLWLYVPVFDDPRRLKIVLVEKGKFPLVPPTLHIMGVTLRADFTELDDPQIFASIGLLITVPNQDPVLFEAEAERKSNGSESTLRISGRLASHWKNVLGLKWLTIYNASLDASVNTTAKSVSNWSLNYLSFGAKARAGCRPNALGQNGPGIDVDFSGRLGDHPGSFLFQASFDSSLIVPSAHVPSLSTFSLTSLAACMITPDAFAIVSNVSSSEKIESPVPDFLEEVEPIENSQLSVSFIVANYDDEEKGIEAGVRIQAQARLQGGLKQAQAYLNSRQHALPLLDMDMFIPAFGPSTPSVKINKTSIDSEDQSSASASASDFDSTEEGEALANSTLSNSTITLRKIRVTLKQHSDLQLTSFLLLRNVDIIVEANRDFSSPRIEVKAGLQLNLLQTSSVLMFTVLGVYQDSGILYFEGPMTVHWNNAFGLAWLSIASDSILRTEIDFGDPSAIEKQSPEIYFLEIGLKVHIESKSIKTSVSGLLTTNMQNWMLETQFAISNNVAAVAEDFMQVPQDGGWPLNLNNLGVPMNGTIDVVLANTDFEKYKKG